MAPNVQFSGFSSNMLVVYPNVLTFPSTQGTQGPLKIACGWPVKSGVEATNPWTCSLGPKQNNIIVDGESPTQPILLGEEYVDRNTVYSSCIFLLILQ